jgi:hypothetical protein
MLSEELVGIVLAILAIISGFLFITAGIGLSLVPPSVPIFGSASQVSSVIYVSGGGVLVTLGCIVMYSILRESSGGSRRGGRLRR